MEDRGISISAVLHHWIHLGGSAFRSRSEPGKAVHGTHTTGIAGTQGGKGALEGNGKRNGFTYLSS